jgi:sulfoxide reductase heme-binding subunit YedZ
MSPRAAGLGSAALWVLLLAPAGWLLACTFGDRLGANPVEALLLDTGRWALRLLLLTLAATPLRRWTGWNLLRVHRRRLGLAAAAYALLHVLVYAVLDQGLFWPQLLADLLKRPFITAGMAAFVLLLPLVATSSGGAMRHLGPRRWQLLHRLVYAATALVLLHFWWMVKADTREPAVYVLVFALLLAARWAGSGRRHLRRPDVRRKPC